jgi:hypothetical protein
MKALLLSPMGSVHRRFNKANIDALRELGYDVELAANFSELPRENMKICQFVKLVL